jgi:TolA-binding protein
VAKPRQGKLGHTKKRGERSVKSLRPITALAASAAIALLPAAALAQRQPASPEQRIDRLERQVQQMQRQVFPRGRPADTAGFAGEPAATQSSVVTLDQRIDALERQMADILRLSEENGHRLQSLEADLTKIRTDQEQRIATLEQRINDSAAAPVAVPAVEPAAPAAKPTTSKPPSAKPNTPKPVGGPSPATSTSAAATPEDDAGEIAYTEGFRLWEGGNYDAAITSLRAFTSAYPKHRRVSYANNLIGRALLDKGEARAAAQALLANYRNNPKGERAPDSLYYLGEALMKLGQPTQACKAYAELDAVYPKARADLKKQVEEAKVAAQCG